MASSTPESDPAVPVDRVRLMRLREEVGAGTVRRFVAAYLDLLPGRVETIAEPLQSDRADGVRAAYDLRAGSQMLGADRLAGMAEAVEQSFRRGAGPDAAQIAALRGEAEAVARALPELLESGRPD